MESKKHPNKWFIHALIAPVIWIMIIPFVILDVFIEIYQLICFPVYGIPYLKRKDYMRIKDRSVLQYLSFIDKINCAYCAYGNGLLLYASKVAGETEKYWCGIKNKNVSGYQEPSHHKDFLKYGDKKAFEEKYCKLSKKKN